MKYVQEYEAHKQYDEMLDECYGEFMNMYASDILKNCDPIAYRCGFNDWCDSERITTDKSEAEAECETCGAMILNGEECEDCKEQEEEPDEE